MTDYLKARKPGEEGEGFFCRFTFGQFFALLVLEVFTLFFVFYLGARYGPQFLGLNKQGAVIVGEAPKEEGAKVLTTEDPQVADMARELVDKAKTPDLKERLAQMLNRTPDGKITQPANVGRADAAAQTPPYPVPPSENLPPAASQAPQAQLPPATGEPPVSDQEMAKAPEPSSMPMRQAQPPADVESGAVRVKSAENAKYSLQVGSYQQMGEANSSVEKWKAKGYAAFLMIADIPDRGRWYRVRVGGFASRDEARKYQQQFESQEATTAIVVMNEQ
jgi:cell division protein FtsN